MREGQYDPENNRFSAYSQKHRSMVELVALGVVVVVILLMLPAISKHGQAAVDQSERSGADGRDYYSDRQMRNALRGIFEFVIVADMDQSSKIENSDKPAWRSVLKKVSGEPLYMRLVLGARALMRYPTQAHPCALTSCARGALDICRCRRRGRWPTRPSTEDLSTTAALTLRWPRPRRAGAPRSQRR